MRQVILLRPTMPRNKHLRFTYADRRGHTVVLSMKIEDRDAFECQFLQLKSYYTDTRKPIPPSELEYSILGLSLLRLLVQNKTCGVSYRTRTFTTRSPRSYLYIVCCRA